MFEMRKKPDVPKPKIKDYLYDGEPGTVEDLIVWANSLGVDPKTILIDYYYDRTDFRIRAPESKEDYAVRVKAYTERLIEWEKWRMEYKDEIAQYEKEQTVKAQLKKSKEVSKTVAMIQSLQKKLNNLNNLDKLDT